MRNVVKDAILQSDDGTGTDSRPGVVILGNNNVVGDGNVVIGGGNDCEFSEQQRYIMERLPGLDEDLIGELCRLVSQRRGAAQ